MIIIIIWHRTRIRTRDRFHNALISFHVEYSNRSDDNKHGRWFLRLHANTCDVEDDAGYVCRGDESVSESNYRVLITMETGRNSCLLEPVTCDLTPWRADRRRPGWLRWMTRAVLDLYYIHNIWLHRMHNMHPMQPDIIVLIHRDGLLCGTK